MLSLAAEAGFVLWGWGAILREGNTQGIHIHPYANISGVYYVSAPPGALEASRDSGKISFYDPRPRANNPSAASTDAGGHDRVPQLAGAFGVRVPGTGRAHQHSLQRQAGHDLIGPRSCDGYAVRSAARCR
jgi:hypothetical protein